MSCAVQGACAWVQVRALRQQLERVQAERDTLQRQLLLPDERPGGPSSPGTLDSPRGPGSPAPEVVAEAAAQQ